MKLRFCLPFFRTWQLMGIARLFLKGNEKLIENLFGQKFYFMIVDQWVSQTDVPKSIHTRPESDKTSSILLKRGRFYLVAPSVKTFCFAL